MISINISEFDDYDRESIYEFVTLQEEMNYEIIIPKVIVATDDPPHAVFWQYSTAAYAGHLLNDVSSSFGYLVPSANKKDYFKFDAKIKDIAKFADLLYLITAVYFAVHETDEIRKFTNDATDYFGDAFDSIPYPSTSGLIFIARAYLD
ncbi:MAG: hypothetical protein ABI760_25420 [Ferruginibacter sp.]